MAGIVNIYCSTGTCIIKMQRCQHRKLQKIKCVKLCLVVAGWTSVSQKTPDLLLDQCFVSAEIH